MPASFMRPERTYTQPFHGGGRHPSTVGWNNPGVKAAVAEWEKARDVLDKQRELHTGISTQERNQQNALNRAQNTINSEPDLKGWEPQELIDFQRTGTIPDRFSNTAGSLTNNPNAATGATTNTGLGALPTTDVQIAQGLVDLIDQNTPTSFATTNSATPSGGGFFSGGLRTFSGGFDPADPIDNPLGDVPTLGNIPTRIRSQQEVFGDRDPARAYIDGGGYNFFEYGQGGSGDSGGETTTPSIDETIRGIIDKGLAPNETLKRIVEEAAARNASQVVGGPGGIGGAAAGIGAGSGVDATNSGTTNNSIFGNAISGLAQGLISLSPLPSGVMSALGIAEDAAARDFLGLTQDLQTDILSNVMFGLLSDDTNDPSDMVSDMQSAALTNPITAMMLADLTQRAGAGSNATGPAFGGTAHSGLTQPSAIGPMPHAAPTTNAAMIDQNHAQGLEARNRAAADKRADQNRNQAAINNSFSSSVQSTLNRLRNTQAMPSRGTVGDTTGLGSLSPSTLAALNRAMPNMGAVSRSSGPVGHAGKPSFSRTGAGGIGTAGNF